MTTNAPAGELTDTFGSGDWIVRLVPIFYTVNAAYVDSQGNSDPQLVRTQSGVSSSLMDQVISFKVGAALWNNENTSTFEYNYNAASYATGSNSIPAPYQYNLIRSVRVSIIGRTEPTQANSSTDSRNFHPFQNAFDGGYYSIRGDSIIVDPRNLTMNND
jgi:hypothetical protein